MKTVKRTVVGGLVAVGLAVGMTLVGASAASATPPSSPGTNVGDRAYGQSGQSVVTYQWNGSSWVALKCTPYQNMTV